MRMAALARKALLLLAIAWPAGAQAAEPTYPFFGNWARSDRACTTSTARERTYSAREVLSSRSRCSVKRIVHGSGGFEVFERCERPNEKPYHVSEIIRMTGPDSMVLTRQTARLKLARSLRYTRCTTPPATPTPSVSAPGPAAPRPTP